MSADNWWVRWPQLLDQEKAALDAAGIKWQVDEQSVAAGIMRMMLKVPTPRGLLPAVVLFPDNYPYFRFQVSFPTLDLEAHQHPFGGNLCLIPRRTHYWDTDDTVAGLLTHQLPKLFTAVETTDAEAAAELEARQAEPYSDYYTYPSSMFLVQSDWKIDKSHRSGFLRIGLRESSGQVPDTLLRGAILQVRSRTGSVLCELDPKLREWYSATTFEGRWARVDKPIAQDDPTEFADEFFKLSGCSRSTSEQKVRYGLVRVFGVLFPEQVAHRESGDGWVFFCTLEPKGGAEKPPYYAQGRRIDRPRTRQ